MKLADKIAGWLRRRSCQPVGSIWPIPAADVDPHLLAEAMLRNGWQQIGHRSGLGGYIRVATAADQAANMSTIIPFDRSAGDYAEMIGGVLARLYQSADDGHRAQHVLAAITAGRLPELADPAALDRAMHTVWLHGNWGSLTRQMTTDEKEAAAAAVLRYDEWMHAADGEPLMSDEVRRELLWWR